MDPKIVILGVGEVCERVRHLFPQAAYYPSALALAKAAPTFDLGIAAWCSEILRPPTLSLAKNGWINTHPSLLPWGRGRDPYYWAIVRGEPFGATIHWMDHDVDAGHIIAQSEIPVLSWDTSETLRRKAMNLCVSLLADLKFQILSGTLPSGTPQPADFRTYRRQDMVNHQAARRRNPRLVDLAFIRASISSVTNKLVLMDETGELHEVELSIRKYAQPG